LGAAKAEVAERVRRRIVGIVGIECEDPGVRAVVEVAATDERRLCL